MNLTGLSKRIRTLPGYQTLLQKLFEDESIYGSLHIPRSARAALIASLADDLKRTFVVLVARADRMLTLSEEIAAWCPDLNVLTFPDPNPMFYEPNPWSDRTIRRRLTVLSALTEEFQVPDDHWDSSAKPLIVLSTARAAMTRTLTPQCFLGHCRKIGVDDSVDLDQTARYLLEVGYTHESLVTQPGQFSRRGGIVDLWPPAQSLPARIEFFGNQIESIRMFNPSTQRSVAVVPQVRITPAREGLPLAYRPAWDDLLQMATPVEDPEKHRWLEYFLPRMNPSPTGLLDYVPDEAVILNFDRIAFDDAVTELEEQALSLRQDQIGEGLRGDDAPRPYLTLDEMGEKLDDLNAVNLGQIAAERNVEIDLGDAFTAERRFGGQLKPLMDYFAGIVLRHESGVTISRQAPRLAEMWSQDHAPEPVHDGLIADLTPGDIHFIHGALSEGWILKTADKAPLHLLTDAEIFGWAKPKPRVRPKRVAKAPENAYAELQPGDWVVHVDFGIGRFGGLVDRTLDGIQREFILIEYDGGDQLYVPIHQADRISRYISADGSPPTPTRLGNQSWEQAKSKVKAAVEEIARDLLQLYAKRHTIEGHAFSPDTPWQQELEASFPYIETEDQKRALLAVKQDMESNMPMDRLICGDVGYGKTEVALRAAFKAVMDGKQVAMLVPTTVLAQQHYNTFRRRLSAFPVEVEMLSRFRSRQEAAEIIERLRSGKIDIIIGTHRLLQRDVEFHDLGLLIIDEEQRFGVTHKEHFKLMRTEVDTLTMTATPIPRTLYLAITGARDISTIDTPPEERLPVITHVGPYEPRLIRQAILREIDRGGQVYFVHNRVQTINAVHKRLQELVPEATITVAHGRMPEAQLASAMDEFASGDIDVLLSTSIIESGLDIPNANTLIIDRSEWFGLAQLYQIRGRVGRGASQGYAYFFRHPRQRTTEEARQRLDTIADYSELGAGYSIAMRDLEIRGTGDILGTRQHGHISSIGFHLYTRLLSNAVRRLKAEYEWDDKQRLQVPLAAEFLPVFIDLPLPTAIPTDYIDDRDLRLRLYRRMADVRTLDSIEALTAELQDRFGPPPVEVENLVYQLRLRSLAMRAGVESISVQNGQILLQMPPSEEPRKLPIAADDLRQSKRGLWLSRRDDSKWMERLEEVLWALQTDTDEESSPQ